MTVTRAPAAVPRRRLLVRPAAPRVVAEAPVRETVRTPRAPRPADAAVLVGSLLSALATAWLLGVRLGQSSGTFGLLLIWYVVFLAVYGAVSWESEGRVAAVDRLVSVVVFTAAGLLFLPLLWILAFLLVRGLPALRVGFFLHDQRGILATDPATAGGGLQAVVGTVEQVGIALLVSVPLGVTTAVLLSETRSRMRRPVRVLVEAMSGLPSEVAGLFIFASLILTIGHRTGRPAFSGVMASLALALIMIPTVVRTLDVVLRLVPDGLREASYALGASQARTVWSVVLPTARSGLATAMVLGVARAVGETAPLIFTALGSNLLNANPLHGPQDALPLFVFQRVRLQSAAAQQRGFTGALVLVMLVLLLFAVIRVIGRSRSGRTARRRWPRPRSRPSAGHQLPGATAPTATPTLSGGAS